ncbi:hypothetical protein M7775_15470 [Sporomusa sphaeroides DSM 2875]|uniref:hypothetical protein n=1 Tax=Sporomusa sphaeroides TaxID=47679 RepID=UPI00202ED8FD|nr:hypothetical protein [Sporomusa sphaeroides]MCM0759957.1 hypothetical protein [Sporomusa sphaeroides DSM 2875]
MPRRNDDLQRLLSEYQRKYGELSAEVIELIKKYLDEGKTANAAVTQALKETGFFSRYEPELIAVVASAALKGLNKPQTNDAVLRKILLHEEWAPDKMNLSQRLHGARPEIRQTIIDSLTTSMRLGKAWIQTARDLYDGYGYGNKTAQSEVPEYLKRLIDHSRKVLTGDQTAMDKYQAAIKQAEYQINKLSSGDAPTKALKAAYSELLDATVKLNQEAIDRAIKVAVEEKSRYITERIARTEISAAWGEAFFAKHLDDSDVIAFRWVLNSRHPRYDICDVYATVDLFGLGPGVYPKGKYPRRPAHPHCMCPIEPVFAGEIHIDPGKEEDMLKKASFNPKVLDEFLESLPHDKQLQLLGQAGLKAWDQGESWQNHLRLWEGIESVKPRINPNSFADLSGKSLDTEVEKWYNKTVKAEPKITRKIQSIVERAGGTMEGLEFRLKTKDSYLRKVESDFNLAVKNDPSITRAYVAGKINDAIRYTAIADEDNLYAVYRRIVSQLKMNGYEVVKLKNTWFDTVNPYRGVNAVIHSPDGQNFELQFHTPASFDLKQNKLHELYEEFRLSTTSASQREKLRLQMMQLSQGLKRPRNIEKIR